MPRRTSNQQLSDLCNTVSRIFLKYNFTIAAGSTVGLINAYMAYKAGKSQAEVVKYFIEGQTVTSAALIAYQEFPRLYEQIILLFTENRALLDAEANNV